MRIEVKTRGTKEFYDEMLYVITYCKKFLKNPKKKAWQYTKFLYIYMGSSLAMLGAFIVLYTLDREWYSAVMIGAFLLALFFVLILFFTITNRIKMYMNDKSDKIIDVNEECISYASDTMSLKMNKDDIGVIVINKYSICILPKQLNSYAISISMDYLDEFLKGASENGYSNMIVDNRK